MGAQRVRADLEGVVLVMVAGKPVNLSAGDVAPEGVTLGDHVTGKATKASASKGDGKGSGDGTGDSGGNPDGGGDLFDPSATGNGVNEVNNYLADAETDEVARVLAAEAAGQNRKGIVEGPYAPEGD